MKQAIISLCLFFSTISVFAQYKTIGQEAKPDFSGTWVLDMDKSVLGRSSPPYDGVKLMINQSTETLEVTRIVSRKKKEFSQKLVYYFDGRGESNPEMIDQGFVRSKTGWNLNEILSQCFHSIGVVTIQSRDEWAVSKDGKSMTWITAFAPTNFDIGSRAIFDPGSSIRRVFIKTN